MPVGRPRETVQSSLIRGGGNLFWSLRFVVLREPDVRQRFIHYGHQKARVRRKANAEVIVWIIRDPPALSGLAFYIPDLDMLLCLLETPAINHQPSAVEKPVHRLDPFPFCRSEWPLRSAIHGNCYQARALEAYNRADNRASIRRPGGPGTPKHTQCF